MNLPALTQAETNESLIRDLCRDTKVNMLRIGVELYRNQEKCYWSEHHESFRDFVETLGIGDYSWVTRLVGIGKAIVTQQLSVEEVLEIGVSKTGLLLPKLRKGELDEDTKALALVSTFRDLREHLGHNVGSDGEEYLTCPRCGVEVTIFPGMVKKR